MPQAREPAPKSIADLACGNGIWIVEESRSERYAYGSTFAGFDVSPTRFPAATPSNLSFETLDMYGPIPQKLHNAFDVVHIRLVSGAIRDADPTPVLENVLQMLKPGGMLQ